MSMPLRELIVQIYIPSFGYQVSTNVLLLSELSIEEMRGSPRTTTLNILYFGMVLLQLGIHWNQCTTTRWVWYYYDELSIEEMRGSPCTTTLNILYVGMVILQLGIHWNEVRVLLL